MGPWIGESGPRSLCRSAPESVAPVREAEVRLNPRDEMRTDFIASRAVTHRRFAGAQAQSAGAPLERREVSVPLQSANAD